MKREDVLKKAEELNQILKTSDEYKAYEEAYAKIKEHAAAGIMVKDFRKKQLEIQKKALEGEDVEAGLEELRKLWEVVSINPYVRDIIEAELVFGQLYGEVMQEIARGIELLESSIDKENTKD